MEVAVIALVFACLIGWHASRVHMSHRLIPVRKGQLPGLRGDRTRHLIRLIVMAAIIVLLLVLVSAH
jgi:hypothetical protein